MLFNSFEFLIFLPIVFGIYWMLGKRYKVQNLFVVAASYFFYGMWDWRFLILIFFTSISSYLSGLVIGGNKSAVIRKVALWCNIGINIGILGFFKYFNFFSENIRLLFTQFGYELDWFTLEVLIPVGISFYTFQAISYSIDVYRGNTPPTSDPVAFLAFVSFFPQLVAGPIERSTNLIPQFLHGRRFDYSKAVDGMRQMLWGFFKKLVIADNCAYIVNVIYADYDAANAWTLIAGGIFFAFQIYGDFSGYSDIAIGCARLFGINLNRNFNYPYFSVSVADFWRRWHISLNTFFRDYIYIPLGGNRVSTPRRVMNTLIVFTLSGLWHGANWTFVLWGVYWGVLFIPGVLRKKNASIPASAPDTSSSKLTKFTGIISTFVLTDIGLILFRSDTLADAWRYYAGIFSSTIVEYPNYEMLGIGNIVFYSTALFIILLIAIEWNQRDKQFALDLTGVRHVTLRWGIYLSLLFVMSIFAGAQAQFIYFQF